MRALLTALSAVILLWPQSPRAADFTSDEMDVRNRIEKDVQKNLYDLISTQLDPKTFTVAVRAKVIILPPPKADPPRKTDSEVPAGLDLGLIDARELVQSYEKQLEEIKILKENAKDKPTQYKITAIEVHLGMTKLYDDEYVKKMEDWLRKKMTSDYGTLAKTTVGRIESVDTTAEPFEEKTPEESLKDWGMPIAIAVLALVILLSTLLFGRSLNRALSHLGIDRSNLKLMDGSSVDVDSESNELDGSDLPALEPAPHALSLDQLLDKIACLCLEMTTSLNDLVRVWMDADKDGHLKVALLVDALIYAKEKLMSATHGQVTPFRIPLNMEFMRSRSDELSSAYGKMIKLSDNDKAELLEKIYWDLISVQTLGIQSLRRPFDFLNGMQKENIVQLLESQKANTKAIAVAYLPRETQKDIMSDYEDNGKAELLRSMLLSSTLPENEIWDLDASLKVMAINQSSGFKERLIDLFPRTVEMLSSLSQTDEIRIIRKIAPDLPDDGMILKKQYPTLAFIDLWKSEYIRKLAQNATADEMLTIIRQVPQAQDLILGECPPKIRTIVEDDLRLNQIQDESMTNRKLKSLRNKWNQIAAADNIPMSKVIHFTTSENKEEINAA